MITDAMIHADKLLGRFDIEGIVCYPSTDKFCCFSAKTNDDLVYLFVKDKEPNYDYKEFGIRKWGAIHAILDLGDINQPETFKMRLETDDYGYPSVLHTIVNSNIKLTHYLQNYTFLSRQPELLELYKQKRFELTNAATMAQDIFDGNHIKSLTKIGTMLNEKYFRINQTDDGDIYFYFGDENQTIDSAKVAINNRCQPIVWKTETYFSLEYFTQLFRTLGGNESVKMKLTPTQIIMVNEDQQALRVAILRGKNM